MILYLGRRWFYAIVALVESIPRLPPQACINDVLHSL